MFVCANGKFLSQKISGVQRYASQLLQHYYPLNTDCTIVAPAHKNEEYNTRMPVISTGSKAGIWWEQVQLPAWLRKNNKPLLLNLCNMAPLAYANKITCIHDIAFVRYPQYFSKAFGLYYRYMMPAIIKTSRHIITVSEFSRSELCLFYNLKPQQVTVIPNAGFGTIDDASAQPMISPHPKPYFLFVGSADPRKNLLFLLKAWQSAQLRDTDLVIAGSGYASFNSDLLHKTEAFRNRPDIHFLGHVSDGLLRQYYQFAKAVVVPSVYEGFGLPVAEALSASLAGLK